MRKTTHAYCQTLDKKIAAKPAAMFDTRDEVVSEPIGIDSVFAREGRDREPLFTFEMAAD